MITILKFLLSDRIVIFTKYFVFRDDLQIIKVYKVYKVYNSKNY